MFSNKLLSNKLLPFALTASVLLNCGCVALVGEAASRRSVPHPPRSTASLHPAALQIAADPPKVTGPDDGSGKPDGESGGLGTGAVRRGGVSREGSTNSSETAPRSAGSAAEKRSLEAAETQRDAMIERQSAKNEAQDAKRQARDARLQAELERRLVSGLPLSPRQKQELSRLRQQTAQAKAYGSQTPASSLNRRQVASAQGITGRPESALSRQVSSITQPSIPSRSHRAGSPGSSIAPKEIKYPKMTVDLGTVHLTRPKSGMTGGGSSDQRQVALKVHYVIDDPKNVPKTLKPNRLIRKFASNCKGDPGNTSRCIPTGGNTSLGGTTLHGTHDHITGVKYCVPGSGGIAGTGASSQSRPSSAGTPEKPGQAETQEKLGQAGSKRAGQGKDYGRLAGSSQSVSEPYHGFGAANPVVVNGNHGGHLNPNEIMATTIHVSHLPAKAGDFRGLVPGAAVPVPDRKWVSDPQAHLAAAAPGPKTLPPPRFQVSPRSIGSFSRFGTVSWGRPVKTPRKKQPYGGDGTGLLGSYYRGNNFQQLLFTRPDRNIDFDWSAAPPDPRFGRTEEYTVRWLGKLVPQVTDTYTLMASSDDGVRVYLDGRLLISNWFVHGPSEDTATVQLVAGHKYDLKIEYFENGYEVAVMKLYWQSIHVPREYLPEQDLRYPK